MASRRKSDEGGIPRDRLTRAARGAGARVPERTRAASPRALLDEVHARRAAEQEAARLAAEQDRLAREAQRAAKKPVRIVRTRRIEAAGPDPVPGGGGSPRTAPAPARPAARPPARKTPPRPRRRRGSGGSGTGGGSGNSGGNGRGVWRALFPEGFPFRRAAYWASVAGLWAMLALGGFAFVWALELPNTRDLAVPGRTPTVTILAADGSLLARRGGGFARAVDIEELPPHVPQAFVAIEDRRFYAHAGLDPRGIARAMWANAKALDVVQGGSTITQQLAKNLFLEPERTLKRKVQETMLALWLESEYSKDEILSLYLNRVYFGAGAYGIEAASQRYFAKPAAELTVPEAAMLAGLVKAPSRLAPTSNPEGAEARAALVIQAMAEAGFLPDIEAQSAEAFPAMVAARGRAEAGYAVDWVEEQLADLTGPRERDITVETTLDPALQAAAVGAVRSALAAAGGQAAVSQGALVAMAPDGAVRALVGGRDYQESQFNRATTARRQPGSAFKTFVYQAALERGLTPLTLRADAPVEVAGYAPGNFSDRYEGQVTLLTALSKSINTVAVRLAHEVGPVTVAQTARRMGIASDLRPDLSLALGTSEVTLAELTGAYAPYANGGDGVIPYAVTRVTATGEDGSTEVLFARTGGGPGRVMTSTNVGRMNAMLTETVASGTGRRAQLGRPAAGKTGTSQENRDAWFVGYTADLVAGVWVGNDNGDPMSGITGGKLPAEIWRNFMTAAHQGLPARPLPGGWSPPIAVAEAPGMRAGVPAYDPAYGPPGYSPQGYQVRPAAPPPREDDEPGFFARLFGGSPGPKGGGSNGGGSNRDWAE